MPYEFRNSGFFRYLVYCLCGIAWLVLGYIFFKYVLIWFMPFIIAFIVSRIIEYPVRFCTKKLHIPRRAASAFFSITTFFVLAIIIYMASSQIIAQFKGFFSYLPYMLESIEKRMYVITEVWNDFMGNFSDGIADTITSAFLNSIKNLKDSISIPYAGLFGGIKWAAASLPAMLISVILTVVSTYFISSDYDAIGNFLNSHMPAGFTNLIKKTRDHLFLSLWKWLKAQLFLMFITFAELTVGFLVLKVQYAGVVALIVAVVDALPILGVGTVLIPWGIISIVIGDYYFGIGLLVLYILIVIVRNTIEPKIVGQSLGLHPLATLICIYIGLKLFGFAGMIIVPIVVMTIIQFAKWGYIKMPGSSTEIQNNSGDD